MNSRLCYFADRSVGHNRNNKLVNGAQVECQSESKAVASAEAHKARFIGLSLYEEEHL